MTMQKDKELEVGVVQVLKDVIYKDIKQLYKIDEYGNIYSKYKKAYLKPRKDKDGYLKISLSGENRTIEAKVATLVAYNFIGEPPSNLKDPTIDHIDNNRLNNYYKNLRWLERSENSSIRKNKGVGELNHEAKLKEEQVLEICELLMKNNLTLKQIGLKYNVSKHTISNIRRKTTWKNITKNYDFPVLEIKRDNNGKFYSSSTGK